jgi:hypothetical protein
MKKLFTLFIFIITVNINLYAQFVENFNYTSTGVVNDDSLTNPNIGGAIWKKHSGTTFPIKFVTTGLSYAGYSGSNIGGAITMEHKTGSSEDVNAAVGSYTTDSVYCSFLLNVTNSGGTTGDYNLAFGATTGTSVSDFKGRIFFKDGTVPNTFNVGISKAGAAAAASFTTANYPLGTPVLVVLKYKIVSGTLNDVASAYIFTSGVPTSEPSTPTITATDNATGTDIGATGVVSLILRQGTVGVGASTIDGIRVANAWYNAPLPVSIKSFKASLLNNSTSMVWNTTNEINVDGFTIERSEDGNSYTKIGFVAAKNKASNTYSFNDVLQIKNATYYRLKITDKDGSFKYSSVIVMNAKSAIKLDVYPNPASNTLVITHPKASVNSLVKIINIDGKNIFAQNMQNGATQSTIDVSKLIKGNYLVVFENDGTRSATQFVKQ